MRFFKYKEFDSPDAPGSGRKMDSDFLKVLVEIREQCGFPFKVNSGYRTDKWNRRVGGRPLSAHKKGKAGDIACRSSRRRYRLLHFAIRNKKIKRIGVYKTFIHLDNDGSLPQEVAWL